MLSRAAERVYWTGRYLERAENAARLIQKYAHLLLDLPQEIGIDWRELVDIVGAEDEFEQSGTSSSEDDVLQLLLADSNATCSVAFAIAMARENIRNTRDLLPHESWENVNELHRFANESLHLAAAGTNQFEILGECIERCQQINGTLIGTMSHHSPFHFLTLGQCLERADMTSRVIDVAAAYLQQNERIVQRYGSTLWSNLLKSVSGFQMYRQYRQPQVIGAEVVDFLLRDSAFPRSIAFCLHHAMQGCESLPRPARTRTAISAAMELLETDQENDQAPSSISESMDVLQKKFAGIHTAVVATWFLPGSH
jgi:uncharacterized alpha-E superfamily protein